MPACRPAASWDRTVDDGRAPGRSNICVSFPVGTSRSLGSLEARMSQHLRPLRLAVLGAGEWAQQYHLPALMALREESAVTIAGIWNRTPERAARAAALFEIPRVYASIEEALDDPQVDCFVVLVHSTATKQVVLKLLPAGCLSSRRNRPAPPRQRLGSSRRRCPPRTSSPSTAASCRSTAVFASSPRKSLTRTSSNATSTGMPVFHSGSSWRPAYTPSISWSTSAATSWRRVARDCETREREDG